MTFMEDVAKWPLTVTTKDLYNRFFIIRVRDCYIECSSDPMHKEKVTKGKSKERMKNKKRQQETN